MNERRYSTYQFVFGRTPNLLNSMEGRVVLTQLGEEEEDMVGKNLKTMHEASGGYRTRS